jgi:hypothetical protein
MKNFSTGAILERSWQLVKENIVLLIKLIILNIIVAVVMTLLSPRHHSFNIWERVIFGIGYIIVFIFSILIHLGEIKFGLRLYDGEKPHIREILDYSYLFLKFIGVMVIIGVAFFIIFGLLLLAASLLLLLGVYFRSPIFILLIPLFILVGLVLAIFLFLQYGFSYIYVIDNETVNIIEVFKMNREIVKGHLWDLFALFLVLIALNIAGVMCLGIGLFLTLPVTFFAYISAYRALKPASLTSTPISI